jgi:hypothetical protein
VVGAAVTVQTSPTGLQFSIDGGAPQTAPQTIALAAGPHTLAVATTIAGSPGTQYVFTAWSDNGSASHTIAPGATASTYTASFKTQYRLILQASPAAGGTINTVSGVYYDAGTPVSPTATANSPYVFTSWGGDVSSVANPLAVTMNAPTIATANFNVTGFSCNIVTAGATPNVLDAQQIIREALGLAPAVNDLTHDGQVTVADLQKLVNAVLGLGCAY